MDALQQFHHQRDHLLTLGYPKAAGLTERAFLDLLTPLGGHLHELTGDIDLTKGTLSFVIVITNTVIPTEQMMAMTQKNDKNGITKLFPLTALDFQTRQDIRLPSASAYLLVDIDRGQDTRNIAPAEALKTIQKQKRTPITIDEGIAIITHFPEFLAKNNCFSLLASRHTGDQRVPAIWINAAKQPNLGWCWDGNPHTWLGSASCAQRIGI
jgi:hypothetical protein